jgi:hypothetical protein
VEQADVWAKDIKLEGVVLNQFNACKGELLELARNQVRSLRSGCVIADIFPAGRLWYTIGPSAI